MRVDVGSLATVNALARSGAERGARALTSLTNVETRVDLTDVTFQPRSSLVESVADGEYVGVHVGFEGGLSGRTALAFDRESASAVAKLLVPGEAGDDLAQSGLMEVGNILVSGFIDEWANHLGRSINLRPPSFVEASGARVFPPAVREGDPDEQIVSFHADLATVDEAVDVDVYVVPGREALGTILGAGDGENPLAVRTLSAFAALTQRGAERAAETTSAMTGIETDVDVFRFSAVPVEDVPSRLGDDRYVGTVFGLEGTPSGYFAVLFDAASSDHVVEALVPLEDPDPELRESAVKELGNVVTSGFVDGWANALGGTVEHTPPDYVDDFGDAILSPLAGRLGQSQEVAFVLDSIVGTPDESVNCELIALPEADSFQRALDSFPIDAALDQQ